VTYEIVHIPAGARSETLGDYTHGLCPKCAAIVRWPSTPTARLKHQLACPRCGGLLRRTCLGNITVSFDRITVACPELYTEGGAS